MNTIFACVIAVLVTSSVYVQGAEWCKPNVNCKPPNCRCWTDKAIPGDLKKFQTPQMILITFGNSINKDTKKNALNIIEGLVNPNNCPVAATFFIEERNTQAWEVKALWDQGFEIALSNENDTVPRGKNDWLNNIKRVKTTLSNAGIPPRSLRGFRGTQLYAGGDDEMDVLTKLGVTYDSTCVNKVYTHVDDMLWPYTYDFPYRCPSCSIGHTPKKAHNGTWQFIMPDLQWKGHNCPSPSACSPYLNTTNDVFDFLFSNFLAHYNGNRAPFNLYLDPLWLTKEIQNKPTRRFLQFLGALSDAWLVTFNEALMWMREPVDKYEAVNYQPWGCGQDGRRRRAWENSDF